MKSAPHIVTVGIDNLNSQVPTRSLSFGYILSFIIATKGVDLFEFKI